MSHNCLKDRAYFKSAFLLRGAYNGPRPERLSSGSILTDFAQFLQP